MSCPVWSLPQFDRDRWDLCTLCDYMECVECTAEPDDMPWIASPAEEKDEECDGCRYASEGSSCVTWSSIESSEIPF